MRNLFLISILTFISLSCSPQKKDLTPEQQETLKKARENFVFVKGGTFVMGNNNVYDAPEHQVTLDSYSISKYETTWEEFDQYHILNDIDIIAPNYRGRLKEFDPEYSVSKSTWYLAEAYCTWLGTQLNLPLGLPTEAQWEYAARSRGQKVGHATDSGILEGADKNYATSKPPGTYPPNPLGLYDMSGGRPEWTNDYSVTYEAGPLLNPRYDTIHFSKKKIVRGWHTSSNSVYDRLGVRKPTNSGSGVGFRCVCNRKKAI